MTWTERHRAQRIALVGATGAVGLELAEILLGWGHPRERLTCFARAAGSISVRGVALAVVPVPADVGGYADYDLALLCTPTEVSQALAPALARSGLVTIDLSSAHRMDPAVPLVVPEINASELARGPRLIANPNCTTAIACLPLAIVDRLAGLAEVVVVSYQAASGAGAAGLDTLRAETRADCGLAPGTTRASPFPAALSRNVIPAVSEVGADGSSGEEKKIAAETRRILGRPELLIEATTARVPVERCHSVAVHLRTQRPLTAADLRAALAKAPGIALDLDPHGPRPRECAGQDDVRVGRVRAGGRGDRSLAFFAVGDQLRKGAALNALQIAAALEPRGARQRT